MDMRRLLAALWLLFLPMRAGGQEVLLSLDARTSRLSLFEEGTLKTAFATPVLVRPEGACGLAFSGYSAFFIDATDPDQLIYELNPRDGTMWNTLPAPAANIDGMAFDQGVLFAQNFAEDRIFRLDPITGEVLGVLEPGVDLVGGLAAGEGRLFTCRLRPPALFELDPRTGQVLRQLSTAAQLPSGLAFTGGRLYVGDYQQGRILALNPDSALAETPLALSVGKVAALDGGRWAGPPPYRLALEQVDDQLQDDGAVVFTVRASIADVQGRRLSANQRSQLEFSLQGPGALVSDPVQQVEAGQVLVRLQMPAGADARLEARLSGLAQGVLPLRAVPRIARIEVSLTPSPTDSSLLQVDARLWDALGQPAAEDTGTVTFSVAWGSGALAGPAAVLAQDGQARTWVRHLGRRGQVAVQARVRALRQRGLWTPPSRLPAPPASGGLVTTSFRVGSTDQTLPAPPTQVRAELAGEVTQVHWELSADEGKKKWFPYEGAMVCRPLLQGYWVLRSDRGGLYAPVGRVGVGFGTFVDSLGTAAGVYRYKVLAEEGENTGEELILAGSAADRRRTVVVGQGVPVDASGQEVLGLFGDDLVVGFDDFFLFADHFGTRMQTPEFDPRFDLDQDGIVGFGDFFIFADHFGKVVAGYQ
jgi:hypothetical protein